MMAGKDKAELLFWLVFAVFVAGTGIFFCIGPYGNDDIWACSSIGINHEAEWTMTLEKWRRAYGFMLHCDNIRLGNLLIMPFLMLPKWAAGLLSTLVLGLALWLSCRVARIATTRWKAMVLLAVLITYGEPWYDCMTYFRYQTNYVWAVAIQMGLIYLARKKPDIKWWLGAGVGLFCGLWHEGMAAVTFASLLAIMLFRPEYRKAGLMWMAAAILAGVAVLAMAPGTTARTGDMEPLVFPWLTHRILVLIPVWTWLVTAAVLWIRNKRLFFGNIFWLICTAAGLAQVAVMVICPSTRGAFTGNWICIFGLVTVFSSQIAPHISMRVRTLAASLLLAFLAFHFVDYTADAVREDSDYERVLAMIRERRDKSTLKGDTVYVFSPMMRIQPWYKAGKTRAGMLMSAADSTYYGFSRNYFNDLVVMPEGFENFDFSRARPLADGWYDFRGYIVRRHDRRLPADRYLYGTAFRRTVLKAVYEEALLQPFKGNDGEVYDLIYGVGYPYDLTPFRGYTFLRLGDRYGNSYDVPVGEPHHYVGEEP